MERVGSGRGGEVEGTPRVGAHDDRRAGPVDRSELSRPDLRREIGVQRGVGPAGATAEPVVVQLSEVSHGREQDPHLIVGVLDVPEMARVVHGHGDGEPRRAVERQAVASGGEPFVDVEDTSTEAGRLLRAEQLAVLLQRRAAPRRVDEHGRVTRKRPHDASGERARSVPEPGVVVQGAAARRVAWVGQRHAYTRRAQDADHRGVNGPLPRVHDAAGEQPDVVTRRLQRRAAQREARQREPRGHEVQSLGEGNAA